MDTQQAVDSMDNIRIAASINCAYIAPSLFQLLGKRQMIATLILRYNNSDTVTTSLSDEYEYIDSIIKRTLGI